MFSTAAAAERISPQHVAAIIAKRAHCFIRVAAGASESSRQVFKPTTVAVSRLIDSNCE
jgi:hypothetical protein